LVSVLAEPVVDEVERDCEQGGEEGEQAPGGGVSAAVPVRVAEDQHRQPCRDHNGDQEVEEVRQGEALNRELIMSIRATLLLGDNYVSSTRVSRTSLSH
jgi:hypothetical protein